MSVLSTVSSALLAAVSAFTIVTAAGCGTDAKGVDDCRDIEDARCAAAQNCGIISTSVAECEQFYRDQCLHGLAVSSPGSNVIKSCVSTITAAGVCALQGHDTAPADCTNAPSMATTAKTTCDIVSNPEQTSECSFLVPVPVPDAGTSGAGGASGAAGSAGAGGTAGTGGATDAGSTAGSGGAAQ